ERLLWGDRNRHRAGDIFTNEWIPYVGDEYSDIAEREYRVVAPLFCFRSVMWHHPDRVLRQFGMEQPIPRTEMTEAEVTRLLGLTR
ncbi:Serine/threonine-protein phosphatase 7 long form homolog, partial [Linum grandiflorum]